MVAGEDRAGCAKMPLCLGERFQVIDSGKVRISMRQAVSWCGASLLQHSDARRRVHREYVVSTL